MEEENAKNAKNKDLTPHYNQSGELEKSQGISFSIFLKIIIVIYKLFIYSNSFD